MGTALRLGTVLELAMRRVAVEAREDLDLAGLVVGGSRCVVFRSRPRLGCLADRAHRPPDCRKPWCSVCYPEYSS